MKKITIVSLASFLFLFLCSAVAILTRGVFESAVVALITGVVILAISGILAFAVKENVGVNIACFLISSVAMGVLMRAWYINRGFNNSLSLMLTVSLVTVLYLWVFFAISRIPFIRNSGAAYAVYCAIFVILSVVGYLVVMTKTETTYVSTFGYYMIIELAFIFAMSLEVHTPEELIRNLTLSTYSVLIVAIIAGVVILVAAAGGDGCDCDCGDGCGDCCDCCDGCGRGADLNPGDGNSMAKKKKSDRV
jgi:hypothetical protein